MNKVNDNNTEMLLIPVKDLYASTKNPRSITAERMEALISSIRKDPQFMIQRPILASKVNGRYVVYAGTQRLEACRQMGLKKVPVIVEENLDPEALDYRMLLDNVHRGGFDKKLLDGFKESLQELLDKDSDFIDTMFDEALFKGKAQKTKGATNKTYYTRLQFQTKDDLNLFYDFMDELCVKYPNVSMSQRLLLYLSQQV